MDAEAAPGRWVVLFDSMHRVLAAERALKERRVPCELVPTPRELSADCGMAIELRAAGPGAVREALADRRVKAQAVFLSSSEGYERVSECLSE